MITCKVGKNIINCYDGTHSKEQLKKWASKNILICPVCNKPYEYCHGEFVSPYFRHKEKDQCEDKYSESESQEHINGKRDLYEWIKVQEGVTNAVLEGWLPETKQRPDIMFKYNSEQYVIEYQCTPIASEYVERHELYQSAGIVDIWILGTKEYFNNINQNERKNRRGRKIEEETNYYYDSFNNNMLFSTKINNLPYIHLINFKKYQDSVNYIKLDNLCTISDYIRLYSIQLKDTEFTYNKIQCSNQFKMMQEEKFDGLVKKLTFDVDVIINKIKNKYKRNKINYSFNIDEMSFKIRLCGTSIDICYNIINKTYEVNLNDYWIRHIPLNNFSELENLLTFIIISSKSYKRFQKISKYTLYDINYSRRGLNHNYDGTHRYSFNFNIRFYKINSYKSNDVDVCIFKDNKMKCRIYRDGNHYEKNYNYITDNDICINILNFIKYYINDFFKNN